MSEFTPGSGGSMVLAHTNVWANGVLIATDDVNKTHFYLNDWLGTRRVQTDDAGNLEQSCASLPYGDGETCGPAPTENLYTGKERDSESGNDYFGARYYASTVGRFLSPDWAAKAEPVPYAKLDNPQSLNLYDYMRNSPLDGVDPDGHCCLLWMTKGIAEDPVGFFDNAAKGAAKGLGQFAYSIAAAGDAYFSQNPMRYVSDMMNQPAALTPSNDTQSRFAFAASMLASAAVPAAGLETEAVAVTAEISEVGTESATTSGYIGDNIVQGSGRVNSDLPGGQQAAQDKFNRLTAGQATRVDPETGHTVAADGTRLRTAADGTGRIERPASVTGAQHETVHFKTPDQQP